MQFEIVSAEVDGTLANPIVGVAVIIWSLLLSAACVRLIAQYRRTKPTSGGAQLGRAGLFVRLAFLFVVTPIAQSSLGSLLYQVESLFSGGGLADSIGFWGGPPVLPAWIVALVCIGAVLWGEARLPGTGGAAP
jgi:hypothetical protein